MASEQKAAEQEEKLKSENGELFKKLKKAFINDLTADKQLDYNKTLDDLQNKFSSDSQAILQNHSDQVEVQAKLAEMEAYMKEKIETLRATLTDVIDSYRDH